ncbi:MAG: ferrous iron transport protein A [Spirochaetes bacterium]|nr:ferrous iron transport protein A [Spirochaetota bacterium]
MDTLNRNSYPLLFAREGEKLLVTELKGGQQFKNKCIDQGIVPGQQIEVFQQTGDGPCLVIINGSRVMIGQNMLNRILVKKQ